MGSSYQRSAALLLEGVQWLFGSSIRIKVAGKSGISQARTRLGWEVVRQLHDEVVQPMADPATKGAWYGGLRLVSLDGSTLDVADEADNAAAFTVDLEPAGGTVPFPQLRFVSLVENGTHVLFASQMAPYEVGEVTLAQSVLARLQPGMLCLADRQFFGFGLWTTARTSGADLAVADRKEHAPGR